MIENFYPRPPRGGRRPLLHTRCQQRPISIHALREEGDSRVCSSVLRLIEFLSTPSARRATSIHLDVEHFRFNFYPRPPRGGRHHKLAIGLSVRQFLSTPSARRATNRRDSSSHFSLISIHALREEGDPWRTRKLQALANFYPRPPRGGRRHWHIGQSRTRQFLSTPSARRATQSAAGRTC